MDAVLVLTGIALVAIGLAGLVLPALPGSPLIVGGVFLLAWSDGFVRLGWPSLTVTVVLGIAILVVDFLAGVLGARAFGASRWALAGAGLGVVVGLFFGLPGILLGPAVGAIVAEYFWDPNFGRAAKAGLGTFIGFLLGSVVKMALAFVLVGIVAIAWFV